MRIKLLISKDEYRHEVSAMEAEHAEEQPERWADRIEQAHHEVDVGLEDEFGVVEVDVPDIEVRKAFARTKRERLAAKTPEGAFDEV